MRKPDCDPDSGGLKPKISGMRGIHQSLDYHIYYLSTEFHKWTILNCPLLILGKLRWSASSKNPLNDCTDVKAGLALYWWQRLYTFQFHHGKS